MATWKVQDKTFIITGAASGLGAKYVEIFLQQGAKSIAVFDIAEDQGKALVEHHNKEHPNKVTFYKCDMSKEEDIAKSIAVFDIAEDQGKALVEHHNKEHPNEVTFYKCDMSKEEDIAKAFDAVVEKVKQVDVIINNAGIMVDAPGVWRTACNVNYQGVVSLTLKGIKHMDKSEGGAGGSIVNIASKAAISTELFMLPIYSGAKIAVLHFCRCISVDPFYDITGVRILCMCFGPTDTPLLYNLEDRTYNPTHPTLGKNFKDIVGEKGVPIQKVESAAEAVGDLLKNGTSGSVWLSNSDRPGKDITALVDRAIGLFKSELN